MSIDTEVTPTSYVFTFNCPDQLGLLAAIGNLLHDNGCFTTDVANHGDQESKVYYSRVIFDDRMMKCSIEEFESAVCEMSKKFTMSWDLRPAHQKKRVLIAVSKFDHCLNVLLTRWNSGVIPIDIVGVVSNHEDCRGIVEHYGIPYHHLPITKETKPQQEQQILDIFEKESCDLLVLARYMQILSDDLCQAISGKAINIHHSFLPSFMGAKPYHQAHARGVKVIGATAHYVTADLDEGPIIAQEVKSIDHSYSVEDMINSGHDTESIALSRAVMLHCEDRVMMNGASTVIL